jgi:hypothetical protein
MPTIGKRLLSPEIQKIFNCYWRCNNMKLMTHEKSLVKLIYNLRMVVSSEQFEYEKTFNGSIALDNYKVSLKQYATYCWFINDGLGVWRYVLSKLNGSRYSNYYKSHHLNEIVAAGKCSTKHHLKLENNRLKRLIVSCDCCDKKLTVGALCRHKKLFHKNHKITSN